MVARGVALSAGIVGWAAIGVLAVGGCSPSEAPPRSASSLHSVPPVPGKNQPASFVMPDVRGMFWVDVARQLQAVGWSGSLLKGPDVRGSAYAPNVIVTQDPGPGERVAMSGMITLQFAGPD